MQTPELLVSIVMPVYNGAKHIVETIRNIQAQQYKNWELLVMDDGSTDETELLVKQINDSRIRYYKREHWGITGKLKNEALWRANGEFVALMDSDDLWPEEKLRKQVSALQQFPDAGFSFTNGFDFYEPGKPFRFFFSQKTGMECRHVFHAYCKKELSVQTSTLLFRESCVKETGLFNENRMFTDFSFIGQLAYHFKAAILYEPLLMRRMHPDNYTNLSWWQDFQEYLDAISRYEKEKKISPAVRNKLLFRCYINRGEKSLSYKKWGPAYKSFFKAWTRRPWSLVPLIKSVKTSVNALFGISDFSYRKMKSTAPLNEIKSLS